jgi:hypothetical protein
MGGSYERKERDWDSGDSRGDWDSAEQQKKKRVRAWAHRLLHDDACVDCGSVESDGNEKGA